MRIENQYGLKIEMSGDLLACSRDSVGVIEPRGKIEANKFTHYFLKRTFSCYVHDIQVASIIHSDYT